MDWRNITKGLIQKLTLFDFSKVIIKFVEA